MNEIKLPFWGNIHNQQNISTVLTQTHIISTDILQS
jgi:hypothetical protein